MITQKNQTGKKTQERFNLVIFKVKSKSTRKNRSFTIATQSTNILLLPTSRNLLTRPHASSETMNSFFLGFSGKYKHTRLCIFKLLQQQLNDHQALEEISFLIILSLYKGKYLSDLTRDSHKQQIEQPKKRGQGLPFIPRQNIKPYTF